MSGDRCRRCGETVAGDSRRCPHCGAYRPVRRTFRFDRSVLAFGCLVAILVVGALLFLLWTGG